MSDKLIKKFVQDANRSAKELLKVDESCPHGEESWYCTKCHDEYVAVLTAKVAEQAAAIERMTKAGTGNNHNEYANDCFCGKCSVSRLHQQVERLTQERDAAQMFCLDSDHFREAVSSRTVALQQQVHELRECLNRLANEASGFKCMADPFTHGHTNMAVLGLRIDEARAYLASSAAPKEEK